MSRLNRKLTIGLTYNMMPQSISEEMKEYYLNNYEWDSSDTIQRLIQALEVTGSRVIPIEAVRKEENGKLYDAFHEIERCKDEMDIVFNFAEGSVSKNRECLIPAFLEWLHIPHTGSDLSTLSIGMDKATTNEMLSYYGVNTPPHIVVSNKDDLKGLRKYALRVENIFPSIVKPLGAGTSIGVGQSSVVHNISDMEEAVQSIIDKYKQAVIIEDFLEGKEYGVGVLGNLVLPIIEFDLNKVPGTPQVRDPIVKEIEHGSYAKPLEYGRGEDRDNYLFMGAETAIAHTVLGCNDYSRSDFRKSEEAGKNYFIEINSLPGLDPRLSDYCSICEFAGIDYDTMINSILWEAIKRYRAEPEYAGQFEDKKVNYINDFISPVMDSLEMYSEIVPRGKALLPEISSISFQLVKAKSHPEKM